MSAALKVICGPMFAGKTSEVIRRVDVWEAGGGIAIVIKPAWDGRYAGTAPQLVTHDGVRRPAIAAASVAEARAAVRAAFDAAATRTAPGRSSAGDGAMLVVIDEAHFFGRDLSEAAMEWLGAGLGVLICGVELDHRGEPFEPFPLLLTHADEVTKLASRCVKCGGPARHSQRMSASDERIVVGGAEIYEARCRACFEAGT
jgi:thymidine kinase